MIIKSGEPPHWAEVYAHELAHHYLFILVSQNKPAGVNINWSRPVYSSIKGYDRPLIGLLHGALAQAYMLTLANESFSKVADPEIHLWADSVNLRFKSGIKKDLDTLFKENLITFTQEISNTFLSLEKYLHE